MNVPHRACRQNDTPSAPLEFMELRFGTDQIGIILRLGATERATQQS